MALNKKKIMVIPKLPWDLESEILSRVPPTSAKQLRFTCKRWNSLFKDPRFIKKHLGKAATQMVLKSDESVYSLSFDFHEIHDRYDQFIKFTGKLKEDSEDVKISKIFHCEGLLLCATKDNRLVVWNPCTGQTRLINQPRLPSNRYTMYDKYFLGYGNKNNACDSFKILRHIEYNDHNNERVVNFEMYEFNSDSWRAFHDANWRMLSSLGVSLKGNTYWLGSDDEDSFLNGNTYWLDSDDEDEDLFDSIYRFDFTTERFERLSSLPFQSDASEVGGFVSHCVLSVVREEKLALLVEKSGYHGPLEMKIWVSNNNNTKADEAKDLSWSVFLVVDFTKATEVIMTRAMSFLVDEENKRVMCCYKEHEEEQGRTIVYVAGEGIYKPVYGEFKKTHYEKTRRRPSPLLLSYVPSLVQIPAKQSNENGVIS